MCARRRKRLDVSTARESSSPTPDTSPPTVLAGLIQELQAIADDFRREGQRQVEQGHPIVAAVYVHIADRLDSANTLERILAVLEEAKELSKWVPRDPRPHVEQKALTVAAITQQGTDQNIRSYLMTLLQAPGRPGTSRGCALWALELHMQTLSWPEVEKRLLPERKGVKNPGETIRREVEFLKRTLERHSVSVERT